MAFFEHLKRELEELKNSGLYKDERLLASPQGGRIVLADGREVLNFCANNYLGLANHPAVVKAAQKGLETYGFGLASVRFICGTQTLHKELERKISAFLGMEDTLLYSSCFDANGGLFETLLGPEDAVISDALNHASIIDGIRLCKAMRLRYENNTLAALEEKLKEASSARFRMIATDGVFSMDGIIANLKGICALAKRHNALVMVDDSHAVGILGKEGRGTHEYCGVMGQVDIITGTLGKALGGASGGYISGRKEIIAWLRQRSRPYLFSNTLSPVVSAASLAVFHLLDNEGETLRATLSTNASYFRKKMTALGFTLGGRDHPIIPILLGDAKLTTEFASLMLQEGIYVIGFSYPVVPQGSARIRTQISSAHTQGDLDRALAAFERVGKRLGVIK